MSNPTYVSWEGYPIEGKEFVKLLFEDLYEYTDFIAESKPFHTGCVKMIDEQEYANIMNSEIEEDNTMSIDPHVENTTDDLPF